MNVVRGVQYVQWSFAKEISVGTISGEDMGGDLALGFPQTFRAKISERPFLGKKLIFPPKIFYDLFLVIPHISVGTAFPRPK